MKQLKKSEYIAIAVALIVVGFMFFGYKYIYAAFGVSTDNKITNIMDLQSEILTQGEGEEALPGDTITVHYTGSFADGTKFDSSYDRGYPMPLVLGSGSVIPGWEKGLIGSKVGEKRKLIIPPQLAYGETGYPDGRGGYAIPPNATLIFEIEIMKIDKK